MADQQEAEFEDYSVEIFPMQCNLWSIKSSRCRDQPSSCSGIMLINRYLKKLSNDVSNNISDDGSNDGSNDVSNDGSNDGKILSLYLYLDKSKSQLQLK